MSKHKQRAIISRAMRSVTLARPQTWNRRKRSTPQEDTFKVTQLHIRERSRFGWRIRIATGDARRDALVVFLIEAYETYLLRKRYKDTLTLHEYRREHLRKRKEITDAVFEATLAWYAEHGKERIQRMRKQHAVASNGLLITDWTK